MTTFLFVGSLNRKTPGLAGANGSGITTFLFDETTGALSEVALETGVDNPSYLAVDQGASRLYAVWEVEHWAEGRISAFDIDRLTGRLHYINSQPTLGNMTCHVSLGPAHAFVSNFAMRGGGMAHAALPIGAEGRLLPASAATPWVPGAHPHGISASPDGRWALATDRGTNLVQWVPLTGSGSPRFDLSRFVAMAPGAGPRHSAIHPNGRLAFVVNELDSTVTSIEVGPEGELTVIKSLPTLPVAYAGRNAAAAVRLNPTGTKLLATNRGHDSFAVFPIESDGQIGTPVFSPSGGRTPRDASFSPGGRFVVLCNEESDNLIVFDVATDDVSIQASVPTGTPMCAAFSA